MKTRLLIILGIGILFAIVAIFIINNYLVQLHNEDIFKQIMVDCSNGGIHPAVNSSEDPDELRFRNGTHFIDNVGCIWVPNDIFANVSLEIETNNSSKLISKSLAMFYAVEQRGLTEEDFKKYDSHTMLLKIKNDGFAFEVDPDTLEERDLHLNRFNEYPDGQYIWLVSLVKNNEYLYHINATDGEILLSALDGTVYPDPQFCADEFNKMYHKASEIPCGCCNPPPGEPVCEPVPLEDHIRDMVTEEFKSCVGMVDRWAYLSEYNDSAWYAFGTNYVKLKMEKTNLEKEIPISITFSGYSQCLDDFHLIIKEHIRDGKVVFEENYNQVCDESKPNNEFKTYREINLEGIGKPISLQKGQYVVELYTDTPQKHGSNYVDKVYLSSHFGTESVIKLDAINQKNSSVWIITGKTTDVKSEIILNLYNPENIFISRDVILPDSDGEFSTTITNGGPLFKLSGYYKITLQQGDATLPQVSRLFNVIQNEN